MNASAVDKNDIVQITCFPGYVHKVTTDGTVHYERNATAARDVLRNSARLQNLDNIQTEAADVNFDGRITAADARILLRYSARLQGFPVTLHVGQELRFGPFLGLWDLVALTESTDELAVKREVTPAQPQSGPGSADMHTLCVTANKPGSYVFSAEYRGYTNEVERSVQFDITCIG